MFELMTIDNEIKPREEVSLYGRDAAPEVSCFCSNSNAGLSWMLTCLPLISLVSASPPSLVTSISIPALIGREMAPQVARAQLPVAGPASRRSISSGLASERRIFTGLRPCELCCSDIWRIYVGTLRPIAPPPSRPGSCGGKIKCHKI